MSCGHRQAALFEDQENIDPNVFGAVPEPPTFGSPGRSSRRALFDEQSDSESGFELSLSPSLLSSSPPTHDPHLSSPSFFKKPKKEREPFLSKAKRNLGSQLSLSCGSPQSSSDELFPDPSSAPSSAPSSPPHRFSTLTRQNTDEKISEEIDSMNLNDQASASTSPEIPCHFATAFASLCPTSFASPPEQVIMVPTVQSLQLDGPLKITPETLVRMLKGDLKRSFDAVKIIDCRFDHEFQGGHIEGAININTRIALEDYFELILKQQRDQKQAIAVVIHCEFSLKRGPWAWSHFREVDRNENEERYPTLHFPNLFLLQGGYKAFHQSYFTLCNPQGYVPMNDSKFKIETAFLSNWNQKEWRPSRNKTKKRKHLSVRESSDS